MCLVWEEPSWAGSSLEDTFKRKFEVWAPNCHDCACEVWRIGSDWFAAAEAFTLPPDPDPTNNVRIFKRCVDS